jgi:hypothetical protein
LSSGKAKSAKLISSLGRLLQVKRREKEEKKENKEREREKKRGEF